MIDEGFDYRAIGEKLGRSTYGVMLRTEWVTIGNVVEESGLTVTFRRGRFRLTEPITTRRK
jgi:hypothetical protein